jgi:hypothetical protein
MAEAMQRYVAGAAGALRGSSECPAERLIEGVRATAAREEQAFGFQPSWGQGFSTQSEKPSHNPPCLGIDGY